MLRHILIGLLGSSVITFPALAQDTGRVEEDGKNAAKGAPGGDAPILDWLPGIEFLVMQDKQVFSVNYSVVSGFNRKDPDSGSGPASTTSFSISASTTLKAEQKSKTILNLNGFSGGSSFGLHLTHSWSKQASGADVSSELRSAGANAIAECKKQNADLVAADLEKVCTFDNGGMGAFTARYNPEGFHKALKAQFVHPITPFVGFDLEGNQDKFEYLDRPSFSLKSESKFGYEARIYAGGLLRDHPVGFRIAVTFARKFDETDPVNLCQATSVPGQTQCLEGADGAPTPTNQRTVGGQLFLSFAPDAIGAPKFAVAPRVTYDWNSKVLEVDAPLYLVRTSERQLSAGVRMSYTSEPDTANGGRKTDFQVGFFVGVPLDWGF